MRFPACVLAFALTGLLMARPAAPDGGADPREIKGWGRLIDPDGDCEFSVGGDRLSIAVPGKPHALSVELKRMNAPRLLQEVEGDFIARVKVGGISPAGDVSEVASRKPFRAAGLLLWQDDENYIRLERARMASDGKDLSFANFEVRRAGRLARTGVSSEKPLDGSETYLRLERRGDEWIASVSADGVLWTTFKPLKFALAGKVRVGVAAVHNTPTPFEPSFEGFKVFR